MTIKGQQGNPKRDSNPTDPNRNRDNNNRDPQKSPPQREPNKEPGRAPEETEKRKHNY